MAQSNLDAVRLQNLRKRLPAIEAELRALGSHCGMLKDSASAWAQAPDALLGEQIKIGERATQLIKQLIALESEARAVRSKGKGPPPSQRSPTRPLSFQTTADIPPAIKRAKQAATAFDRNFRGFTSTVNEMMTDPLRAADLLDPTGIAKVIGDLGLVAELYRALVEWRKRKA